jgi:hypothetical protein
VSVRHAAIGALACAIAVTAVCFRLAASESPSRSGKKWIDVNHPWGSVTGIVRDGLGVPVEGATVLIQDLNGFGGRGETDAEGRFRVALGLLRFMTPSWRGRPWLDALTPHASTTIHCTAEAPGYCGSSVVSLEARRSHVVEAPPIVVFRGGYVVGKTWDRDGNEVAARVRVARRLTAPTTPAKLEGVAPGFPAEFVASEIGGGFRIGPIVPGEVELWATIPGVGACSEIVAVSEGITTAVDLSVNLTVHLSGRVVDGSGSGVPETQVICRREDTSLAEAAEPRVPSSGGPADAGPPMPAERKPSRAPRATFASEEEPPLHALGLSAEARASRHGLLGTRTDEHGCFYFYGLQPDATYEVFLSGCKEIAGASVRGVRPSRGDLRLEAPFRRPLRGRVEDEATGSPVPGCVVQVLPESTAKYLTRRIQLGARVEGERLLRADSAGRFETVPLPQGVHCVCLLAPGYEVEQVSVALDPTVGGGARPFVVRLRRAAAVVGIVRADGGGAVAGADVQAWCPRRDSTRPGQIEWIGSLKATTGANGTFRIEGLPAGEWIRIRARDHAGGSGRLDVELGPCEVRDVVVGIQAAATLTVAVAPTGRGAREGHPVRLIGVDDAEIDVALTTDEDGFVRVTNLAPGRYKLLAVDVLEDRTRPDVAARVFELDLSPGERETLVVEVPDVAVVSGTVALDGAPVRTAKVGFGPVAGTRDHFRPLLFDVADGVFRGRVPPGTYHVHVRIPGRRFELAGPIEVPNTASATLDVSLDSADAVRRR